MYEAVAKLAWVGATTQTVQLYGKEAQRPNGNFATASGKKKPPSLAVSWISVCALFLYATACTIRFSTAFGLE